MVGPCPAECDVLRFAGVLGGDGLDFDAGEYRVAVLGSAYAVVFEALVGQRIQAEQTQVCRIGLEGERDVFEVGRLPAEERRAVGLDVDLRAGMG